MKGPRRRVVSPTGKLEELHIAGFGRKIHDLSLEFLHLFHSHAVGLTDDGDHSNNLLAVGSGARHGTTT